MRSTLSYMNKCSQKIHLDESGKGFYVCSICECTLGMHIYFIHCPLVDNELICIDCCQNEASKEEIMRTLSDIMKSQELTREKIDAICKGCGNRNVGDCAEDMP